VREFDDINGTSGAKPRRKRDLGESKLIPKGFWRSTRKADSESMAPRMRRRLEKIALGTVRGNPLKYKPGNAAEKFAKSSPGTSP